VFLAGWFQVFLGAAMLLMLAYQNASHFDVGGKTMIIAIVIIKAMCCSFQLLLTWILFKCFPISFLYLHG
jgi:hypothetical protein